MLLKKKTTAKLQTITCAITSIQEYPGKLVIGFERGLTLNIPYTEQGWSNLCKIGYLAGLRGEFEVRELLGCKMCLRVFNKQITKIIK